MKPFDNYEISPCRRFEEPGKPGLFYFEVCEPHEAHVWTLYGHLPEGGVEAIGDFAKREDAEETFQRITGIPFGSHDEVEAHLRVMHAGSKMLAALQNVWKYGMFGGDLVTIVRRAIAEATDGEAGQPDPIVIEVRGGVVVNVQNVPHGYQYEIKDHDDLQADEASERVA